MGATLTCKTGIKQKISDSQDSLTVFLKYLIDVLVDSSPISLFVSTVIASLVSNSLVHSLATSKGSNHI